MDYNIIKAELVYGDKRKILIGAYIPPSGNDDKYINIITKMTKGIKKENIILTGDFNINFEHPKNDRQQSIATEISNMGLINIRNKYKLWKKLHNNNWTWFQYREKKKITAICDYIFMGSTEDIIKYNILWTNFCSDH